MGLLDRHYEALSRLNREAAAGEISYDDLVREGAAVLDEMNKVCPHENIEAEVVNGERITWCNDCLGRVPSG